MRKISEPYSNSRPHITIRGPIHEKSINWNIEPIHSIEVIGINNFFLNKQNTVLLHCYSEEIENISYKPDYLYGGYQTHITLYDGNSRKYANKLFSTLSKYKWKYRIILGNIVNGVEQPPKQKRIILKRRKKSKASIQIDDDIRGLYNQLFGEELTVEVLINMSDQERIIKIIHVYKHMDNEMQKQNEEINDIDIGKHAELYNRITKTIKNNKFDIKKASGLGQFLTPPEIALEMAKVVKEYFPITSGDIRFGDPAIGTGTFFRVVKIVFSNYKIESSIGIDIDKEIVSTTRTIWGTRGLKIFIGDYLLKFKKYFTKRNIILCNPPYLRSQMIPINKRVKYKNIIQKDLGIKVDGRSGLFIYFILHAHNSLEENGLAAWLIPSEWMENDYGRILRKYLTEKVELLRIHKYDPNEIQFENVIVSSTFILYRKKKPNINNNVKISYHQTIYNPETIEEITIGELSLLNKWRRSQINTKIIMQNHKPLDHYFSIKRGVATGANDYFIIENKNIKKYGIPKQCCRPILPNPRELNQLIIESDTNGYPIITPKLFLIDCKLKDQVIKKKISKILEIFTNRN